MAKEKLFGFNLHDASALLLFIMSISLLIVCIGYTYFAIEYYNNTGSVPVAYVIIIFGLFIFATYVLYKTIKHRKKQINR